MAPDLDNVVSGSVPVASDIRVEVDAAVDKLAQKLREVNRKVLSPNLPFYCVSTVHADCISDLGESRTWRT
jgi:hypothetical protein